MHFAGSTGTADESIDPSARKKRGPQDDNAKASVSPVPSVLKGFQAFRHFVNVGQRLAEIDLHYEQQPEYPLKRIEKKGEQLDYRVEKMKLSKDKTQLICNRLLTLDRIPPDTCEYHLGNRSALEWILDQCQVSTDKRSGITNAPNRADHLIYILRLIGRVITISWETMQIGKPRQTGHSADFHSDTFAVVTSDLALHSQIPIMRMPLSAYFAIFCA